MCRTGIGLNPPNSSLLPSFEALSSRHEIDLHSISRNMCQIQYMLLTRYGKAPLILCLSVCLSVPLSLPPPLLLSFQQYGSPVLKAYSCRTTPSFFTARFFSNQISYPGHRTQSFLDRITLLNTSMISATVKTR